MALNVPVDQLDHINVCRTFYPQPAECTFPQVHGEHPLAQAREGPVQACPFKRTELTPGAGSDRGGRRLELSPGRRTGRGGNSRQMEPSSLRPPARVTKRRAKPALKKKTKNENTTFLPLWDAPKAVLRGKFVAIEPISRNRKIWSNF